MSGAAPTGLAGYITFSSGESATIDCRATISGTDDGQILDVGAHATIERNDVRLAIPLSVETVTAHNIDRLTIRDAAGEDTYTIPVSPNNADIMAYKQSVGEGQLLYEQYIGQRPFHGHYTVTAENQQGTAIDTLTIEFNCYPDSIE